MCLHHKHSHQILSSHASVGAVRLRPSVSAISRADTLSICLSSEISFLDGAQNTASVPRCCHTALQLNPHMAGHAGSRCSHQHKSMGSAHHRAPASSPSSGWRPSSCPDAVCLSAEHQRALAACKKHTPHALLLLWVISSTAACMP